MTAVRTASATRTGAPPVEPIARARAVPLTRIALAAAAAVFVVAAWRLPIWEARLSAPQYPHGLSLTASAGGVTGDIDEIDELNHYVGIRSFDPADAPEMKLWLPTIVLALILVAFAAFARSGRVLGKLARIGLWSIPIGALMDVQFRLYQYGHGVQPDAAIRIEPFTPLVIGSTKVLNFTTFAFPGAALGCLFAAAFLFSGAGPSLRLARRGIDAYRRWGVEEAQP